MNLTKVLLAPSPACFEIAVCIIYYCKGEVRLLSLFSKSGADNCHISLILAIVYCLISGNLPPEISDSAPTSAPFF